MGTGTKHEVTSLLVAGLVALAAVVGVNRGIGHQHSFANSVEPRGASALTADLAQGSAGESLAAVPTCGELGDGPGREERAPSAATDPARRLRLRGFLVAGKVIDLQGQAVPGAGVQLPRGRDRHHDGDRQRTTDANGHFVLETDRGGELLQLAGSSGYIALASTRVGASRGERGGGLVVAARAAGPLQVEIVDAKTGLVLPGARVEIRPDGESEAGVQLREQMARDPRLHGLPLFCPSDVGGIAFFEASPATSKLRCSVSRPGYVPKDIVVAPAVTLQVALDPVSGLALLTGRVTNAVGEPVAGAEVASGRRVGRTRRDGTFTLNAGSASGGVTEPSTVSIYHPQHGTAKHVASGGEHGDITLVSTPPASALPLLDAQGEALASVRVVPVSKDGEPNPFAPHWYCAQADAKGRVALRAQPEGDAISERVAVAKDGTVLGRVALSPTGDSWVVVNASREAHSGASKFEDR